MSSYSQVVLLQIMLNGFALHRLEGHGTFTDVHSQVWYGNFTHKAAPGLKFKLNL